MEKLWSDFLFKLYLFAKKKLVIYLQDGRMKLHVPEAEVYASVQYFEKINIFDIRQIRD